jgi:hypothetical protein
MALDQIGLARRHHADRHIGLAHRQVKLAVIDQQRQLDIGIQLQELTHARGQPFDAEGEGGGDLERPSRAQFAFGQHRLGHRQLGENVAGSGMEDLALLGQDQAPGVAVKQRDFEAVLKRADLAADRRLAEIQCITGVGEATGLRHRVKDSELVPIHPYSLSGRRQRLR